MHSDVGSRPKQSIFATMADIHYVVGIAGGSASGKTSFLKKLKENLPLGSVSIISQDNYYKPQDQQQLDDNGEVITISQHPLTKMLF